MAYYITDIIERYEADLQRVTQYGNDLAFVEEQTPEICLAAVKRCQWALCYVNDQTYDLCLEAIKQNVKKQTHESLQFV
jgi:hypothetical protein